MMIHSQHPPPLLPNRLLRPHPHPQSLSRLLLPHPPLLPQPPQNTNNSKIQIQLEHPQPLLLRSLLLHPLLHPH